ncbi:hypothetical protein AB0880_23110 [Micromonospora chersina]|uniref:hypothetical protein n=1 Tax=Micromonospora chersina TaxID=47854 RepID=UPI0034531B8D
MSAPVPAPGHQPEPALPQPGQKAPGPVLATAILLYVGGALTLVYSLAGASTGGLLGALLPSWALALYGLLYLGLGWGVQHGRRWARRAVLVLCAVGVAFATLRLVVGGVPQALGELLWPVVYAVLLNTETARVWFRRPPQPAA